MELQLTYRIRHNGIESTPHSLDDLRQMWRTGQIDNSTKFKRSDSSVWFDANDLRPELEKAEDSPAPIQERKDELKIFPAPRDGMPLAPSHVRVTSIKIPFREILVLVLKFYLAAILLTVLMAAVWILIGIYLR